MQHYGLSSPKRRFLADRTIGLGNGAVFKLVPDHFPRAVGSVTGRVGAAGGLGGFFPPLVLGGIRQATGSFTPGFVLPAAFSLGCLAVCRLSTRQPN
jgi:MFS transporter, NNP family, nitrate/nitrite transporter